MTSSAFNSVLALQGQLQRCGRYLESLPVAHPKRVAAQQELARLEAQWLAVSAEDIESLRKRLSSYWALRFESALRLTCMALFAVALTTLVFSLDSRELTLGQLLSGFVAFPLVGAAVGWVVAFPVVSLLKGSRQAALDALCRAKEQQFMCGYALEQVHKYKACEAWRDAVIGAGRELVMLDLAVISQRAYESRQRQAQAEHDTLCRQLHGLEAPAGA